MTMLPTLYITAGLLAAPVLAQTTAPSAPSAVVVTAKPAKAKPICRTERVSGSLMAERRCHSATEWAALDSGNAREVDDAGRRLTNLNHVQTDHVGTPAFQ